MKFQHSFHQQDRDATYYFKYAGPDVLQIMGRQIKYDKRVFPFRSYDVIVGFVNA